MTGSKRDSVLGSPTAIRKQISSAHSDDTTKLAAIKKEIGYVFACYCQPYKAVFFWRHHHHRRALAIRNYMMTNAQSVEDLQLIAQHQVDLILGGEVENTPRLKQLIPNPQWRERIRNIFTQQDIDRTEAEGSVTYYSVISFILKLTINKNLRPNADANSDAIKALKL